MVKRRRTAPPRHRLHHQPFARELDGVQLRSSQDTVAVRGRRPVLDSLAQSEVEDASGIGVDESFVDITSWMLSRRRTGQAPQGPHQHAEVRPGTGPAHVELRDRRPAHGSSDTQRRTHPPDERRRVTLTGWRAVIEVAVPVQISVSGLQPAHVLIASRDHQVALGHDDVDEVEVRCLHKRMLLPNTVPGRGSTRIVGARPPSDTLLSRCSEAVTNARVRSCATEHRRVGP